RAAEIEPLHGAVPQRERDVAAGRVDVLDDGLALARETQLEVAGAAEVCRLAGQRLDQRRERQIRSSPFEPQARRGGARDRVKAARELAAVEPRAGGVELGVAAAQAHARRDVLERQIRELQRADLDLAVEHERRIRRQLDVAGGLLAGSGLVRGRRKVAVGIGLVAREREGVAWNIRARTLEYALLSAVGVVES